MARSDQFDGPAVVPWGVRSVLAPVLLALVVSLTAGSAASAKPTVRQKATVVAVVDGDTIRVTLASGKEASVRLIGIDTPETYPVPECGGAKATKSLKRMVSVGEKVRLISDPTQASKDQYGRLLRYIEKIDSGRDLNRAQVLKGWARLFVFDDNPFKRVKKYREALVKAKKRDRGIWGRC